MKSKCFNENVISLEDFFNYFKGLYSSKEVFQNDDVDNFVQQECAQCDQNQHMLSNSISVDEDGRAIFNLKCNKSAGFDRLIPEMAIACKDIISPPFCKLFNFIFEISLYPESWTCGVVMPIPKKGDKTDVNNYRGITLTSIFSKIFSHILDIRLRKYVEVDNHLTNFQNGFSKVKVPSIVYLFSNP